MKRYFTGICLILICLSLCACGSVSVQTSESTMAVVQETQADPVQEVKIGEKIVTDNMEILINGVELTYDVLPDDTSGFYTHYAADAGKVYISVDASVTNKAKQNLGCDEIGRIIADYNDGYTYKGFIVVKDSSTGFTYANISSIAPLDTQGIKWLIECPQEVEESENPLFLEFTIDGAQLVYYIR